MTKLTLSVLALTTIALPGLAAADVPDSCGTAVAELNKTWSKSDKFGDENFGAAYDASATLQGKRDGLSVAGNLNADAMLFGNTQNVVKVIGKAEAAVVAKSASESLDVFVMGKNIFRHSRSSGTGTGSGVTLNLNKNWDVTFFNAEKRFWVGPVPVKVKAAAAGSAGVSLNSNIGIFAVNATLVPSAKAYATATASVDAWVAEAGVDGKLTLVEASVPTAGELNLTTVGVYYKADSDLALNYLSGRLNVFAKALGKRYEKKIADWSGSTKNIALAHEAGCVKLF
ncbi:MAG TPA: hypothetical protein PKI49_02770 [Pseudomonadota bacterium]|jgi:hypothetical protein|nr:hypothetical protein [Pseudomonadota bacterium]HNO67404.1 hypothetical protein [Pseudomonadota bacterium]